MLAHMSTVTDYQRNRKSPRGHIFNKEQILQNTTSTSNQRFIVDISCHLDDAVAGVSEGLRNGTGYRQSDGVSKGSSGFME
jgi:hypothetical protein